MVQPAACRTKVRATPSTATAGSARCCSTPTVGRASDCRPSAKRPRRGGRARRRPPRTVGPRPRRRGWWQVARTAAKVRTPRPRASPGGCSRVTGLGDPDLEAVDAGARVWRFGVIDGEILRFAALQLSADAETIHAYARRQQTVSAHQRRIGQYLRLRTFDRRRRTAGAVPRGRSAAARSHGLAAGAGAGLPSQRTRPRAGRLGAAPRGGGARQKAGALLAQCMAERLSASMRNRLDVLVAVGDDEHRRGRAPRRPARCAARLRAGGAAAVHPP